MKRTLITLLIAISAAPAMCAGTMSNIPFSSVDITDGFWKAKQEMLKTKTVPAVYDRFSETYRFEALKCQLSDKFDHHIFWDSDVAKWMEGAAYVLQKERDPKLEKIIDDSVEQIVKNADENGYFNSCYLTKDPQHKFTNRNNHELYCAGHLIEAAIAYKNATGKDTFLKAMCKYADYIEKVFKIDQSANFITPGHPELELALVKLYNATGEKRYLVVQYNSIEEVPFNAVMQIHSNDPEMRLKEVKMSGRRYAPNYLNTMVNDLQITQTDAESDETVRSVGGMFGTIANTMAVIARNYVSGEIKGHTAGGIIGLIKDSPLISIDSAITNVDITGSQYAGAVAGLVDIADDLPGLFTADDLGINSSVVTYLQLTGKYNGVSISKSGILGTVSNTESASGENIFSGGLYGQYTAHFNVVDNSYIYVALGPNAQNAGSIGGLMNVTVIQLLNDLYYWDQYPNFYGSAASVIKPVIPAYAPVQLPKPLPFIDFSLPDKTAKLNGGALVVDETDPSKNVTLYQDNDGRTNEIELKLYGIDERVCKFVQYNSFHKSIRHSVEKLCQ